MTLISEGIEDGDPPDTTTAATIESVCELQSATSDDNDDEQMKCNVIPFGFQQRAGYMHGKMFSDLMGGKRCTLLFALQYCNQS